MSTKASITGGTRHHLYFQEYLDSEPRNVFFELIGPSEFSVTKETTRERSFKLREILPLPAAYTKGATALRVSKRR